MSKRKRNLPRGWYPVEARDCKREIESFIEGWSPRRDMPTLGVGGIVPHAGWYFSGRLAARVFHTLKSQRKVELVVLYGGHMGSGDIPRVVTEEAWETPLGDLKIHRDFVETLMKGMDMKKESPSSGDNTIEVQLAMVKHFFPEAEIVAVRSPQSSKAIELGNKVAEIAKARGVSILAIGSTDLTHYGPNYGFVAKGIGPQSVAWVKNENDLGLIKAALKMDGGSLLTHAEEHDSACSAGAAVSALTTCKAMGAEKGVLLDYYTSYDIMADASFVGYAGIVY